MNQPPHHTTKPSKNPRHLVKVDYVSWPSPPPTEKRLFKRQRPSKTQESSAGVFASKEVQEYGADGINVMQLLLAKWHKSLARDLHYFRSFQVYGLVKLQEARNATQFLGGNGVNNTVTCTAWELLTQLFSTIPPPAGEELMSVLAHLVHPLFSNVDHVLTHIAKVADRADDDQYNKKNKNNNDLSSSFDAGAITYQEINARLLNKIKRLTTQSAAMDGGRKAAARESAKRQLIFNGTIAIWQKGLKKFVSRDGDCVVVKVVFV